MGKADILKALVKLNGHKKVENADGDMVFLLDDDNKVDVDSLRDEDYEVVKEVFFQTIEDIMDAHGTDKIIPQEFGKLYNQLVNEAESELEEEAEVEPTPSKPKKVAAKKPAKKPAPVKQKTPTQAPPDEDDTRELIVKLLVKFKVTAELLVSTIDDTIKAVEKK